MISAAIVLLNSRSQFMYVEDFAFDLQSRLLATDAAHAYVQVFDKTMGQYISRFGGKGDKDGQLEKPEGSAVRSRTGIGRLLPIATLKIRLGE